MIRQVAASISNSTAYEITLVLVIFVQLFLQLMLYVVVIFDLSASPVLQCYEDYK